eukprot:SAG31_NODE_20465_length_573_cov_1.369198_1_plen_31_part_01
MAEETDKKQLQALCNEGTSRAIRAAACRLDF